MKPIVIRISNVWSWMAFALFSAIVGMLLVYLWMFLLGKADIRFEDAFVSAMIGGLIWLGAIVINYIAVGSFRILPWKSISDDSAGLDAD